MFCTVSKLPRFLLFGPTNNAINLTIPCVGKSAIFPTNSLCSSTSISEDKDEQYQQSLKEYVRSHWDDQVSRSDWLVQRFKRRLAAGDRAALAEAITLVESRHPTKKAQAEYLLAELLTAAKRRYEKRGPGSLIFRVGITGSPGVGKSSFIEVFGKYLIDSHQKKVAVLTIDPSSQTTGGKLILPV